MKLSGSVSQTTKTLLALAIFAAPVVFGEETGTPDKSAADKWTFTVRDRRDPFTFAKVKKFSGPKINNDPGSNLPPNSGSKGNLPPEEIDLKRREALKQYELGERMLMDGSAKLSMDRCDEGLNVFRDVDNINSYPELQEVRERIYRLRKAATRVKDRNDADSEFLALGLRITGIVSRERKAQAIVNGKVSNKGDVITASSEGSEVVIDEIRPDQVIFLYKTFRMALPLSDVTANSR
jgi:hypothetical protein